MFFTDWAIIWCLKDIGDIPWYHFKFVTIEEIATKSESESLDVAAIIVEPGVFRVVHVQNGSPKTKKTLKVWDDSGCCIDVTIWGEYAKQVNLTVNSIVIF